MTEEQILERISELRVEIEDHKAAIIAAEPTLHEIAFFVSEHHPKKQEQRDFEAQMRVAQGEVSDLEDLLRKL